MSTAALFVEAVDTLFVLLRSAALWFVLLAFVAGVAGAAAVMVVRAVVCGVWRALRAVWARGRARAGTGGAESPTRLPDDTEDAPKPPRARTAPRIPKWAHTQPIEHEWDEAA